MAAAGKGQLLHAWQQQGGSSHARQHREGPAATTHGNSKEVSAASMHDSSREGPAATMHGNSKEGSTAAMHDSSREGPAAAMLSRIRNNQLLTCMAAAG
eukprot:361440-Chlamydomonas_euryale.AAC.3